MKNWSEESIGRKDTPFNADIKAKMMAAYGYLDELLRKGAEPFSKGNIAEICELNNLVHYGSDSQLRQEFQTAIAANSEKFYENISPIVKWYVDHMKQGSHPLKVSAEVYVAIVGYPQLFIEGNHRAGSVISSWISMYYGHPPFVLSYENAIAYFEPSAEIKTFADKSTWRGRSKLPKYRSRFKEFWEGHISEEYVVKDPESKAGKK